MEHLYVTKAFDFNAAHFLPGYKGKCARMHGHTWRVEITVAGAVVQEDGMVFDFSGLKKIVEPWIELLDHHTLNEIEGLDMPTAENIGLWVRNKWEQAPRPITLSSIKVWESSDSSAEWIDE